MVYKWCAVPGCTNTSIKTPEKLFLSVPKNRKIREKWMQLARRNPRDISVKSTPFFCEDHFCMEKDIVNYSQYKMGFSQILILAEGTMPSKFFCQPDRRKRMSDDSTTFRPAFIKRKKTEMLQGLIETFQRKEESQAIESAPAVVIETPITTESSPKQDQCTSTENVTTAEKAVQFKEKVHYRSKAVQTNIVSKDVAVSPHKWSTISSCTSPFKIEQCANVRKPSKVGQTLFKRRIAIVDEEKSGSEISEVPKQQDSSSFAPSSSIVSDSDSATTIEQVNEDIQKIQCLQHTLCIINRKPMMYIGISKESYFLVHLIHKHTHIPHEHILLSLKKIRLGSTFSELEDNFGLSLSYASKIFLKNIPLIANVLRPFIVDIDKVSIKKMLPISFRHNFYNVSCIIDCLEIDIQKPSKALFQALTWSDYKKGNTVKYLISCTPNGLVNYISPGFGGRVTDVTILQNCDFLDRLGPDHSVLADRGFKHVEQTLNAKGIKLLRPPSVPSGSKLSKAEVRQTKIIASLRIHIERVIRRLREFHMLKQHHVINKNFLRVLDDVIVIACALINTQDSLIK